MTNSIDKSVINAAVKGDIGAFKKIFDYYLPKMRPVALRYARTSMEADDILQESFVKIFHGLKDFKSEGSFEGWLRRIVVNTALSYFKKYINYYDTENIDELSELESGWVNIEDVEDINMADIINAIEQLPIGYKTVFNLYVLEELSHKEIAQMLGISEGTSRSQYSKARKMLKKNIAGEATKHKEIDS